MITLVSLLGRLVAVSCDRSRLKKSPFMADVYTHNRQTAECDRASLTATSFFPTGRAVSDHTILLLLFFQQ